MLAFKNHVFCGRYMQCVFTILKQLKGVTKLFFENFIQNSQTKSLSKILC